MENAKKSHSKPVGSFRSFQMSAQGAKATEWGYEGSKEEIEQRVISGFYSSMLTCPFSPFDHQIPAEKLEENHLDFSVTSNHGETHYMDLVEVAPLAQSHGFIGHPVAGTSSPYARLLKTRTARNLGDFVLEIIKTKAIKYDKNLKKHILTYNTDSRLTLDMCTKRYLRVRLAEESFGLESVCYFDGIHGHVLFPDPMLVHWHDMLDSQVDMVMTHVELEDAVVTRVSEAPDGLGRQPLWDNTARFPIDPKA